MLMLQLDNFSAWVSVDSAELQVYATEYSKVGKQVTCWIPSEVGKNFAVCWHDSTRSSSTFGRVRVDGIRVGGKIIRERGGKDTAQLSSTQTSATTERPFTFSKIVLTDDDSYLDASVPEGLGEIELVIWRVIVKGSAPRKFRQFPEDVKVHERSKKATNHRVRLGEEVTCKVKRNVFNVENVCRLVTFVFRYRPLEVLKANGIVPVHVGQGLPAISSAILDEDTDDDDSDQHEDNSEQIKALEAILQTLKNKQGQRLKKVKLEKLGQVKMASGSQQQLGDIDIIDLT